MSSCSLDFCTLFYLCTVQFVHSILDYRYKRVQIHSADPYWQNTFFMHKMGMQQPQLELASIQIQLLCMFGILLSVHDFVMKLFGFFLPNSSQPNTTGCMMMLPSVYSKFLCLRYCSCKRHPMLFGIYKYVKCTFLLKSTHTQIPSLNFHIHTYIKHSQRSNYLQ